MTTLDPVRITGLLNLITQKWCCVLSQTALGLLPFSKAVAVLLDQPCHRPLKTQDKKALYTLNIGNCKPCSWAKQVDSKQINSTRPSGLLKGQCHEIFDFWFFHESVFPQPLSIPLGLFRIFSKIRKDIRSSRCSTGVVDTGDK